MNSISGLRALANTSRTCRALASPYFFKPLECEFNELEPNHGPENTPVVILSAVDNPKTLNVHREPKPRRHRRVNITQVLNVENTFGCFECLSFRLPPPALDLLSRTLPLLSRLVINLENFVGYSTSWDQAHTRAKMNMGVDSYAPLSYRVGLDSVCAIARFRNLRHLTLHFKLHEDEVMLMHPSPGCQAVREVLESIRGRQEGQRLARLEVVFCANWFSIYTLGYRPLSAGKIHPPTVSTTMITVCSIDTPSQASKKPQCHCTCSNPQYGKVIERRKRLEKLYGEPVWRWHLEYIQNDLFYGRYSSLLWAIFVESLTCLALLPSYFIFEDGKRVRFPSSLTNMEVRCHGDSWRVRRPRPRLREVWRRRPALKCIFFKRSMD